MLFEHYIQRLIEQARKASLPGFEKIPIYDVIRFFLRGLQSGALTTRASSTAFHFFLAFPPAIIFFYTIIPFLPFDNFQSSLLNLMENVLPRDVSNLFDGLLADMFVRRTAVPILGLLTALIFAMNGINGMIVAFNASYHSIETRHWLERRLIALLLVVILLTLVNTATSLIIFSKVAVRWLLEYELIGRSWTFYLITLGKWVIIIAMIFFAISFLYYLAPSRRTRWKFFSAGSSLASLLVILASLAFSAFINNFGKFNEFFGSMGTLMVILLWLYFNSLALLIGFELNASIGNAKLEKLPS